jgi:hypothetical protein
VKDIPVLANTHIGRYFALIPLIVVIAENDEINVGYRINIARQGFLARVRTWPILSLLKCTAICTHIITGNYTMRHKPQYWQVIAIGCTPIIIGVEPGSGLKIG